MTQLFMNLKCESLSVCTFLCVRQLGVVVRSELGSGKRRCSQSVLLSGALLPRCNHPTLHVHDTWTEGGGKGWLLGMSVLWCLTL